MQTEKQLNNLRRFSSENQPQKKGRKKGRSATDWLRKLSHTKINFQNPLTGKADIGEVNLVVAIQLILKATQDGDLASIKEYIDRLDGKIPQKLVGEGFDTQLHLTLLTPAERKQEQETSNRISSLTL